MLSLLNSPTLTSIHDCWKNHSIDYMDILGKMMSLLFNTLSRFVIAFLPRSKPHLWSEGKIVLFDMMYVCVCVLVDQSCPTLCNLMDCIDRLFCLWDSPGKNTRVGCQLLLQGIFLTQDWTWISHIEADSLPPFSPPGKPWYDSYEDYIKTFVHMYYLINARHYYK